MSKIKGNSGKARQSRQLKKLAIVITICLTVIGLYEFSGMADNSREKRRTEKRRQQLKKRVHSHSHSRQKPVDFHKLSDDERLDLVLGGIVHLRDIKFGREGLQEETYSGVMGVFCKLDWQLHKDDPSSYPMFHDLIEGSNGCNESFELDLKSTVDMARNFDELDPKKEILVKSLQPTGFVFHESRCGSTLVANSLAAMNPPSHRVYSESGPPITAARACGMYGEDCPEGRAAELLRDVVYLMGRTNNLEEEKLFFKIQSIGTKFISVFTEAFPDTPWIYVYRQPVHIMMSQLSHGVKHANCVRQLRNVSKEKREDIEERGKSFGGLSSVEKCALHLSLLCESAVDELQESNMGRAVNYEGLVDKLIENIIPNHFKVTMTNEERENIKEISSKYSKGRGSRAQEWKGDSEQKEKDASSAVREAAEFFLQSSFEDLEDFSGNEYYSRSD